MKTRVCICCGEEMPSEESLLSRNPNVCASCSSLADGMEEPAATVPVGDEHEPFVAGEKPAEARKAA